jgi:hypothetical protein
MHDPFPLLAKTDFPAIHRDRIDTLQANLGYRCNQSCTHCHVAAGPQRTEEMDVGNDGTAVALCLGAGNRDSGPDRVAHRS